MKNIISVMLFLVAFSINANAQQANSETKKEACCAISCNPACCDDASCDMDVCDASAGCCDMAAGCCVSSAVCGSKASADSFGHAVATEPSRESCTMAKSSCKSANERPIKV